MDHKCGYKYCMKLEYSLC